MFDIRTFTVLVALCVIGLSGAQAAMELTYSTSGDLTIITAADGPTTYYEMQVQTSGPRVGRIKSFIDLSGASSETWNYAHNYSFGAGLIDPMDAGTIRDNGKYTISDIVAAATQMSYRLTEVKTRDAGTATYSIDITIGLPTVTAAGYDLNIHTVDTIVFDALWDGNNADGRVRARMRLDASADNDEYTFVAHNGVTEGPPDVLSVEATVTGANPDMATGSTFTQTLTYGLFDGAYDKAAGVYAVQSTPYAETQTDLGITGTYAGNPGDPGAERTYSATVDYDISIIPEPATLGLLALGGAALLRRRRQSMT